MHRRSFIALTAGAAFSIASPAHAHGLLAASTPAANATVRGAITALRLRFSERLEPNLSQVRIENAAGNEITTGALGSERGGRILVAHVPALAPGVYRVHWRAVSVDTHITEGDYSFTVAP